MAIGTTSSVRASSQLDQSVRSYAGPYSYVASRQGATDRNNRTNSTQPNAIVEDPIAFRDERVSVGAATLLFHPAFQVNVPNVVLEGAPGQGKSTIGQYICQVQRARLLDRAEMLEKVPREHNAGPLRLPFRIDLRDLALWLARRDPFNIETNSEPLGWHKSLEAFLCAQIRHASGGAEFSVSDLQAVVSASSLLIVFDGLDESRRHRTAS